MKKYNNHVVAEKVNLLYRKGDFMVLKSEYSLFIVTHGSKDGYVLTPKGRLVEPGLLVEVVRRNFDKVDFDNIYLVACHEDARSNEGLPEDVDVKPFGSKGEMDARFLEYFMEDGGDLEVRYNN